MVKPEILLLKEDDNGYIPCKAELDKYNRKIRYIAANRKLDLYTSDINFSFTKTSKYRHGVDLSVNLIFKTFDSSIYVNKAKRKIFLSKKASDFYNNYITQFDNNAVKHQFTVTANTVNTKDTYLYITSTKDSRIFKRKKLCRVSIDNDFTDINERISIIDKVWLINYNVFISFNVF